MAFVCQPCMSKTRSNLCANTVIKKCTQEDGITQYTSTNRKKYHHSPKVLTQWTNKWLMILSTQNTHGETLSEEMTLGLSPESLNSVLTIKFLNSYDTQKNFNNNTTKGLARDLDEWQDPLINIILSQNNISRLDTTKLIHLPRDRQYFETNKSNANKNKSWDRYRNLRKSINDICVYRMHKSTITDSPSKHLLHMQIPLHYPQWWKQRECWEMHFQG